MSTADTARTAANSTSHLWDKAPPTSEAEDYSIVPVVVEVGQSATLFYLTETRLRAFSKFFDTALKKEWLEGQQRKVPLPDEDPELFNVYANWIMTGKLFVEDESGVPGGQGKVRQKLVDLYILGDKLLDTDFKDRVTDALASVFVVRCDNTHRMLGTAQRDKAYAHTTSGASLRRMIVGQLAAVSNTQDLISEDDTKILLLDVALELTKSRARNVAAFKSEVEACAFHEHVPGSENCYRSRRV
ncbi:Putative BTB/POZ domain-containing protein [Septoria linicola]|uniref:BTB/POZ domain-containing protein n=1 Tax=Septoria linicola TaxID=215465 RepID=A0A9Q9AS92_9PEZI|nr:Putative BTB/POZ domain-containing protein [Septoria linicola]